MEATVSLQVVEDFHWGLNMAPFREEEEALQENANIDNWPAHLRRNRSEKNKNPHQIVKAIQVE